MRKNILITTVSAIVLMSASHAFAADEENPWDSFKAAVEAGGTVTLDNDLTVSAGGAITTYLSGTVIDGNGHTISAPVSPERTTEADFRFINEGTSLQEIKNITFNGGHFITSTGDYVYAPGGAIYNFWGNIGNISGNFEGNYAQAIDGHAVGGAIYNEGTIGSENGGIWGNFVNNHAEGISASGGAIYNTFLEYIYPKPRIWDIHGDFESNFTKSTKYASSGGAIYNEGMEIGDITGDFTNNYAESLEGGAEGGAIYHGDGWIGNITGNFVNNHAASTVGAAQGGAIYNRGDTIGSENGGIWGSFLNNYVSGNEESKGGAIYSNKDITIVAKDGRTSKFAGNYVLAGDVKTPNAVYMKAGTLNLASTTNGQIIFEDEIDGEEGYKIAINSEDKTGNVIFNNNIRNADITLAETNVTLGNAAYISDNNNLTINSGNLNLAALGVDDVLTANSIRVDGGVLNILEADVDLAGAKMGQIDGNVLTVNGGKINVEKLLLTSDSEEEATNVLFIKDTKGVEVSHNDKTIQKALAPVYKYDVSFNAATGEFMFTRAGAPDVEEPEPDVDVFNEGVFAGDVFMMSSLDKQDEAAKRVINTTPTLDYTKGRVWAMPFYSDDTISYKNFYDVDSKNYGLIAGIDTRSFGDSTLSHVYTLFGAYSEGRDKYEGIKVENKSWLLGLKASMFSDNGLYGDAIVDIASHDMDAKTLFGSDSHDTYGYGAALKGGHKHDIEKVNIDTSVMLSWQQVEGDDFTAASGAKMKTDDYSRLSLMPQIKVGYDLNSIRPYALARYNFVLDEDGSSAANGTTLPEIESKNYVEYGLGIETTTNSNHSGFAHILRHDGGREGWSVTAGYRYNF